jgi:two-component system response regulator
VSQAKIILLVEDDPGDEELALLALRTRSTKSEVVVARDGVEALHYIFGRGSFAKRDPAILPDLVLLDLKLPKLNGIEVLREIRADPATRLVPVVILTSSNEERDVLSAYEAGANSYIRKPVDFATFAEAAGQLQKYWLVLNHGPPVAKRM